MSALAAGLWLATLGATFQAPGAPARARPIAPQQRPTPIVAKLENAAAQLAEAVRLRGSMRGQRGVEREERQRVAIAAFRAVREHWPADVGIWTEAEFRAGEMLRAADDVAAAREAFERVLRGPQGSFRDRAAIELGLMARRERAFESALAVFRALLDDPDAAIARREEARLWLGRCHADLGQMDAARTAWRWLCEHAEGTAVVIDAHDELAQDLIDRGDLEGAAGWIAAAKVSMSDRALEETERGEAVRRALENMHAIRRLERAVRARAAIGVDSRAR